MPSTLPPTVTGIPAPTSAAAAAADDPNAPGTEAAHQPKYVVSPSGHAAHPTDILASCQALNAHLTQVIAQAERDIAEVAERIRAEELAEKRRVAPGWLDSEARLLEPERAASAPGSAVNGGGGAGGGAAAEGSLHARAGAGGEGPYGAEMLLQQPVSGLGGAGMSYGERHGNGYGHGPGGASEMAVPDEGEQLDRAFGSLQMGKP